MVSGSLHTVVVMNVIVSVNNMQVVCLRKEDKITHLLCTQDS